MYKKLKQFPSLILNKVFYDLRAGNDVTDGEVVTNNRWLIRKRRRQITGSDVVSVRGGGSALVHAEARAHGADR